MGHYFGVICFLFTALLVSAFNVRETVRDITPSFVRSAVESMPKDQKEDLKSFAFGEKSLPLRAAVESLPAPSDHVEKTFVRSSVEHRPVFDEFETAESNNIKFFSGPFDAYDTSSYDPKRPQPFRGGSSFQEIVSSPFAKTKYIPQIDSSFKLQKKDDDEKKVLCFVTNWSFYRKGDGRFVPEQLDSKLCSHVIYSFASLDPNKLTVKEFDKWSDVDNDLYRRTTSLADDVPVLLAVGGWTDSAGSKYSRLVSDAGARRKFIQSIVPYLKQYNFKGLYFDWNYPKCWQSDCRNGPDSDRPNFTRFIEELARELRSEDLLLGISVSGYKEVIVKAYDIAALSESVDFMTVMTYDYHGAWEKQTGHISPLRSRPNEKYPQYTTESTLNLLIKQGAKRNKLIVGIPFYGQSFTLDDEDSHGFGAPTKGPGRVGEFTKQPGMLAYYEICDNIRSKSWRSERDPLGKSGPYAYKGDQWVGYENVDSVIMKARYVIESNFGGIAAWTVDLDDFNNRCCLEPFPLLNAINRELKRISSSKPISGSCKKPPAPVTPVAPVMTPVDFDNGAPAQGFLETTTWPSWKPGQTSSTSSSTAWWQTTSSSTEFTWWPTSSSSSTTRRTTTTSKRPITTTTTRRPTTASEEDTDSVVILPHPVNTMPIGGQCDEGGYLPDEEDCTSYYRCVHTEWRKETCANGLEWNKRGKLCDWPHVAKCKPSSQSPTSPRPTTVIKDSSTSTTRRTTTTRKPITTTRRTTTRRPPTSTTLRPKPSSGVCENGQFYPDLSNCEGFAVCVNNHLVPNDCGHGYHWNQELSECDLAKNVRCISSARYYAFAEKSNLQLDDPCNGDTKVPYPGRCDQYLQCLHGNLQAADCPPELHWNNGVQICDWPKDAKCDPSASEVLPEDENESSISESEIDSLNDVLPSPAPPSTTPKPVTPRPEIEPLSGDFKLVCYFTNWAWYRRGIAKYTPDNIDTRLCTHIVYGFAVLDYSELTIRTHDSWADIDNKFYERVSGLKSKGVKVSLALGGWNDSQGDKYSRLVRSPGAIKKFVKQATEFVEKYGFEGLDLDWEYPVCWQTECQKGFSDEKEGFAALVKALSDVFKPKGLLLSTAVSPSKTIIDKGYDVPELSKYFDWIAVMTYDYHGQWDKKTGHVAPLYQLPDDEISYFNANFSINYWIEKGAPPKKIVMGVPLYGQAFTLSDAKNNGLNARASGPGQAGEFTRAAGFLAYYEICDSIKNKGWTVVQDPLHRIGPYAYKGNQWVGFDDKEMVRRKALFIRKLGLGGGMIWALDLDDFNNRCGDGHHPLLGELQSVLRDPPSSSDSNLVIEETEKPLEETAKPEEVEKPEVLEEIEKPEVPEKPEKPIDAVESVSKPDLSDSVIVDAKPSSTPLTDTNDLSSDYKVVCYFTNWAWYRQNGGKYLPEDIDAKLCTHIVYGFAVLDRERLTIKPHDSWADLDNHFYERVVAYKAKGIKVSVAIGGWNDSAGDKYSRLVRDATARARFIKAVIEFIEKHGFEGLDLDWEYPVCWQVECNKGFADEKEHFAEFVKEISDEFRPRGLLLSSAVSPSKTVIDAGYEVETLSNYFDWIAVMAYDYHGQWDKITGHVAPMYLHPEDVTPVFNTNFTIHYWIEKGADPRKLVLGMPMYGQSFSLAEHKNHGLNVQTYGGGEAGDATRARGFLSYYEICERIQKKGWKVVRDKRGRMGPYAYSKDQWVSFDDALMIKHKSEYVKAMNLGGAMIWALDLDDFRNVCGCEEYPLLRTINRVLNNYPGPHPKCPLESLPETDFQDTVVIQPTTENNEIEGPTKSTTRRPISTTTKSTTSTTELSLSEPDEPDNESETSDIDCSSSQFVADKSDCNAYYICNNGQALLQNCAPSLHWNEAMNICDWPHAAKCEASASGGENGILQSPGSTTKKPITKPTTLKPRPPRPTLPANYTEPVDDGKFKVVCYFTNWAWYRPGEGKYKPDDIDENLCTHIIYGFAVLNGATLTIKTHDSWADIDNHFYEKVTDLRKRGKRVSVAIGGWNDSLGDKYSRLVLSANNRARFITDVIEFIEKYNFDGLDLDWEYPVCWQVECHKGKPQEKEGFADLVKELSDEFKPRNWLLTAAVSPSKMVIDAGYDIPVLSEYFDWIAVMTYDYHGQWDRQTGHVSPLYYYPGDKWNIFNSNYTINYWIEQGASPRKLVMGVPMYGQSFTLSSKDNHGLNAPSYGPGEAGKFTRAGGFLSFYEICEKATKNNWNVVRDPEGRIGPYAYHENQWVSYDDVEDVRRKAQYMKKMNLAGGMVWALDLDDFRGTCGCGIHPLLTTLNQELRDIGGRKLENCT